MSDNENTAAAAPTDEIFEPLLWKKGGWTARVVKNDEDEGWAVEMTRDGDPEPALVGPWVMGRDKKSAKPLNTGDFNSLVKAANDVITRHEHAMLPRKVSHTGVNDQGERWKVECFDVHDEDEPHAILRSSDEDGFVVFEKKVRFGFKVNAALAEDFARTGEV